jgi:hypothetical protein
MTQQYRRITKEDQRRMRQASKGLFQHVEAGALFFGACALFVLFLMAAGLA